MAATDGGDVNKLKVGLNKEDAMLMVDATATSKKPSEEDQSPAGIINPLLLLSAREGSLMALNVLLEREDAKRPPLMIISQEFLELVEGGSSAQGRTAVSIVGDVEGGVDDQPAASLAVGALLKGVTPDGDTALHVVAQNQENGKHFLEYAGIIYERGRGLLFAKNHRGDTPLHCAARAGNSKMVSHLMNLAARSGADMKLRLLRMENKRHETALHEAVRFEDGRFLGRKERRALIDATTHTAAEERNKDDAAGAQEEKNIVKLLMGADPELANYPADGVSPLYLAILLGKSTIALILYDKSGGNLSYSGANGQNALHVGVLPHRDSVMMEFLVHWNKSLTTQVDKDGRTPLHFASSLILRTGSYLTLELLGRPPWCHFVWIPRRSTSVLEIVFKANPAALYQADKNGSFPIHLAASVGAKEAILFFRDKYPHCVGLRDAEGRTFLQVAVEKEILGILFYVCETPSLAWILNMQDNDGNTALHLAIQSRNFRMFCALFGNPEVNLNITNYKGETPLDLSIISKLSYGLNFIENSEHKICHALKSVGANYGVIRWDKAEEPFRRPSNPEEEDQASRRLKDAAQTCVVASVLIATVAFSATLAIPGGYRADDHTNEGTPIYAGSYLFDAFIMSTTLAFICSSLATLGYTFSASPFVNLVTREVYTVLSVLSFSSSFVCMSIAFALGVYMVLAPVARNTAVAVCVITPTIWLGTNVDSIFKLVILARPLCIRKGLFKGMVQLLRMYALLVVTTLWPFIVTFGWAALARIHRHR